MFSRLERLVAIDSVSSRSNLPIIEHLERETAALGLTSRRLVYRDEAGVEKACLIAATSLDSPPALAFEGHTDTVPYDGWAHALTLRQEDGRLVGRGSCDTKGFSACALEAASRVDLRKLRQPLAFIFTADEETGCTGARKLAEARAIAPRFVVVGEPTNLQPIRAHKGYAIAHVTVEGRECHSSHPELGRSAINAAADLILRIEGLASEMQRTTNRDFDPPHGTLNVGTIAGGTAKNIVAGLCSFPVEWRPMPGEDPDAVLTELQRIAEEVARKREVAIRVDSIRGDRGIEVARDSALVKFLEKASGNPATTVPYYTDAPHLAELGGEAVVFGPGDIRQAHTVGEYVPIADLERCTDVLERAIREFCF